jgi:hypothetical protein
MPRSPLIGTAAGAVGTVALDITTYANLVIRGGSPSSVPSRMVNILADKAGIDLSAQGKGNQDSLAQNRESALGALLGYINGLGVGTLYGLLRSRTKRMSLPLASIGVGVAAMAASDVPIIALRASDPKTWGLSGWVSDVIPHLIYGLVTVFSYEVFTKESAMKPTRKVPIINLIKRSRRKPILGRA